MSAPHLVAEFLAEIEELCPTHTVYRQGDCVTAHSSLDPDRLSGTIYPYTDQIVLHCHDHRFGRRLYLEVDIQHPTETDRILGLFRDHLDGKLQDSDYNGR